MDPQRKKSLLIIFHYTDDPKIGACYYPELCNAHCNNVLLDNSIFTTKSSIDYLDIIEHR
jgi:hypothetical protein